METVDRVDTALDPEHPLITIVIPARNEAADIADTLDACLAIDYERKEIIVVDDSSDDTPQIVAGYAAKGVRLIHREVNRNGCCGARNLGMQSALGEIIVLMNADDRPRPDFLRRILPHYQRGADCLVVQSLVLNRDTAWSQYLYARVRCKPRMSPHWSEGFSCRRQAVAAVNYIPGDFPLPFCRDNMLSQAMVKAGFTKHADLSIVIEHLVPATLSGFWRNRVWRGTIAPLHSHYFGGRSVPLVLLRESAKALKTVLLDLTILPLLLRAARYARYTARGWRDVPVLVAVGLVHDLAVSAGNLKGAARLAHASGGGDPHEGSPQR
jgi:glycosyltransferase involved in cell wall biosynthesis